MPASTRSPAGQVRGREEAKVAKVSKASLRAAMARLLDSGRIRTEPTGRSDRGTHRLAAMARDNEMSLSTPCPHRAHTVSQHTPPYP
jgi:hypothetical protein